MATQSMMTANSAPEPQGLFDEGKGFAKLFFSHAFRPFFLGAGIYSMLALAAWLLWIGVHAAGAQVVRVTVAEPLHFWHAHEMVFGFGAAAVGGFLLTAVPNWTGARHSQGAALAFMFFAWIAGRAAMWFTAMLPPVLPFVLDMIFLPVLGIAAARQLAVKPALRHAIFLALILALVAGNGLYHAERTGLIDEGMQTGVTLGLVALVVMIAVIGGRVVPAFTTNALRRQGVPETGLPVRRESVDRAALILTAVASLCMVLPVPDTVLGAFALGAAVANGIRLAGWRGLSTLHDPIVWVLHVAYLWIVIGFALLALEYLLGWGSGIAALHAFGTGAVGTMILAIMSRAALGHTGRSLVPPRAVVVAYVLVSVSAVLRTFGPMTVPELYNEALLAAGFAWIAAFALYTIAYAPILLGPRIKRSG